MTPKILTIIIPVYNEAATIYLILDKIKGVQLMNGLEKEIIVIDDGSTDPTKKRIQEYMKNNPKFDVQYYEHTVNKGKGAALHTGISKAKGDYLIIQDADLEYDPNDYNDLLKPLVLGIADVVYGSRFIGSKPHRILFFLAF